LDWVKSPTLSTDKRNVPFRKKLIDWEAAESRLPSLILFFTICLDLNLFVYGIVSGCGLPVSQVKMRAAQVAEFRNWQRMHSGTIDQYKKGYFISAHNMRYDTTNSSIWIKGKLNVLEVICFSIFLSPQFLIAHAEAQQPRQFSENL
jgi:hypothetical protein